MVNSCVNSKCRCALNLDLLSLKKQKLLRCNYALFGCLSTFVFLFYHSMVKQSYLVFGVAGVQHHCNHGPWFCFHFSTGVRFHKFAFCTICLAWRKIHFIIQVVKTLRHQYVSEKYMKPLMSINMDQLTTIHRSMLVAKPQTYTKM